jgi:putative ABC transport system ATP-binding protein
VQRRVWAQKETADASKFGRSYGQFVPQHLIDLHEVVKAFKKSLGDFVAPDGLNLQVDKGGFVAVVGKSGSGKSTLIDMITGIYKPASGLVYIENVPVHTFKEGPLAERRGLNVGVKF